MPWSAIRTADAVAIISSQPAVTTAKKRASDRRTDEQADISASFTHIAYRQGQRLLGTAATCLILLGSSPPSLVGPGAAWICRCACGAPEAGVHHKMMGRLRCRKCILVTAVSD